MKIALTIWGNRISPVFDSARTLLIVEIVGEIFVSEHRVDIAGLSPADIAKLLKAEGVRVLVCGAISEEPALTIEKNGVELVSFVAGNVTPIMAALESGEALDGFVMPGCRGHWNSGFRCCERNREQNNREKECCASRRTGTAQTAGKGLSPEKDGNSVD